MLGYIASNPDRRRFLSRYCAVEALAAAFACASSLVFPMGPLLALLVFVGTPETAGAIAAIWVASGLVVVLPGLSDGVITWLTGVREPTPAELTRMERVWSDVCRSTGIAPDRFALRVEPCPPPSPDEPWYVNAFTAGTSIVCVTADSFALLGDDELGAILAHELGHHAGFDAVPRALIGWYLGFAEAVGRLIAPRATPIVLGLIYMPALAILALVSRPCEFAADAFAARIGYAESLRRLLLALGPNESPTLISALLASHPATVDRIRRLERRH